MKKWLKINYYWIGNRSWVYKDITPRIICEKNLSDCNGNPPEDYKIFCFNGEPKLISVDSNRFTSKHAKNFYDLNWSFLGEGINYPINPKYKVEKPKLIDEMLDIARKLSSDFPHVRVDLYVVKDKIYFGELTFFNDGGLGKFTSEKFELSMGNWLDLSSVNAKSKRNR